MAFKLTYTDGQESDYDDGTKWEFEAGVLKLGRDDGDWSVYVSPGHWATLELVTGKKDTKDRKEKKDKSEKDDDDKNEDDD